MESSLYSASIQTRHAKITWRQKPREQSICGLEPPILSPRKRYPSDGISREDHSDCCVTTVVTLLLASVFVTHLKGYGMPFVAKRPGLLRQGLVILHDKGGPLTPNRACMWLFQAAGRLWTSSRSRANWIGRVKKQLVGKRFEIDAKLKQSVTTWLQTLDTDFLCAGLQIYVPTSVRCLNVSSDYVEVWCVPCATHVPCIHRSRNKVFGMWMFVTLFLKLFCRSDDLSPVNCKNSIPLWGSIVRKVCQCRITTRNADFTQTKLTLLSVVYLQFSNEVPQTSVLLQ